MVQNFQCQILKVLLKELSSFQIVVKKKKVHSDENYHGRTESSPSRLNFDVSYTPAEVSYNIIGHLTIISGLSARWI